MHLCVWSQDPAFAGYSVAISSVDAEYSAAPDAASAEPGAVVDEYVHLDLRFNPSQMENAAFEAGDTIVRGSGTGYALGREPVSAGKAVWEYVDLVDNANDETRCGGVSVCALSLL